MKIGKFAAFIFNPFYYTLLFMTSNQIRNTFLEFFKSKQHHIVASAPMVIKNDPTLMFTNAGMNQFKDIFLGNDPVKYPRIADTQKCLRVSGKHNDLEEVGMDTYHHTMFEMLGNWSFGDYFKKEAIEWAWELLTEVYRIDKGNLYVTVFEGDASENIPADHEAYDYWKNLIAEDRIIFGNKKDNFWEMGDTGPCGPCSEIHVDLRTEEEKLIIPGKELVNTGHSLVIEIWNLVFIEFNRKSDGRLESLPAKHVDTGMGFERLNMVLQGKKSNYDTDVFQPIIKMISELSGIEYGENEKTDIAMRVIADHLRAVSFAIADGQLPSNNKAGYVIRRILRRAVRYGYTFLNLRAPFIHKLVLVLVENMSHYFPELNQQLDIIVKVIHEEEMSFLKTLSTGIRKFDQFVEQGGHNNTVDGRFAFELFDTYGFPVDLTQLMAKEINFNVDMAGFKMHLEEQKNRSRQAALVDTEDWIIVKPGSEESEFVGYDSLEAEVKIVKFRKVKTAKEQYFQIVLNKTPFYAESGGQVGDSGWLKLENATFVIEDTRKENNLIVHITRTLPEDIHETFNAVVDPQKRLYTTNNHSATHLMHAALRKVLGTHVEQKGSLVTENNLRFDFSHFSKMSKAELREVEKLVNQKIRENISMGEYQHVKYDDALKMGAMALFGEKYGEEVRVITFDNKFSVELCGGTHVEQTGQIGHFKIISESAIAAGIRRIEAITAIKAEEFLNQQLDLIDDIKESLKGQQDILKAIQNLQDESHLLNKTISELMKEKLLILRDEIAQSVEDIQGVKFSGRVVHLDGSALKDLSYLIRDVVDNLFLLLASHHEGKVQLSLLISDNLVKTRNLNAGSLIREIAKEVNGGGGGQANFATAGGKNPDGIAKAIEKAKELVKKV